MTELVSRALLRVLRCPICRQNLDNAELDRTSTLAGVTANGHNGSASHAVRCSCGTTYPVIDGVIRILSETVESPTDLRSTQQKGGNAQRDQRADFDQIRRSFSKEWGIFDYNSDKTWGWTLSERKNVFLADVGLTDRELKNKTILDAGCGNGTLTTLLGALGAQVVGIDLNERLGDADKHKAHLAGEHAERIHFIQGNIFDPPFKENAFDLIYCSGVIHHTPDSRETFNRLAPLTKPGGRLYIWVYGKRSAGVSLFLGLGRQLKRIMSLDSLLTCCRIMAPLYKVTTEILNALRISRFRRRSIREITLDLFDAWAPQYNHWHTEGEVESWFRENGFENLRLAGRQKHGFGFYGDRLPLR